MIDFVSTHPAAHPQTVACARLLAAVIAQAIEDASKKPQDRDDRVNAAAAINWLFDETSLFTKYAHLIGADARAIREALLAPHKRTDVQPTHSKFDEGKRRRLRQQHVAWLKHKEVERRNAQATHSD